MLSEPQPEEGHPPSNVLRLLVALDEASAVRIRHGRFVGVLHAGTVPGHLWDPIDAHEPALLRLLPNGPTPYQQRQEGRAA
jgi:hypothetical protein